MIQVNEMVSLFRGELVAYVNASGQLLFGTVVEEVDPSMFTREERSQGVRRVKIDMGNGHTTCPRIERVGRIDQHSFDQMKQWWGHMSENFE